MLKKSMSKSAMMIALITGSVIWGGTVVQYMLKNRIRYLH
jgi:hypothetical protein